jgi:transcriptional regulator with PAS, ATPase and Fis domain
MPLSIQSKFLRVLQDKHIRKVGGTEGKDIPRLERSAERVLEAYPWPGNVRELENAMRHALTFCKDSIIHAEDLPARIVEAVGPVASAGVATDAEEFRGKSLKAFLRAKEKEYIAAVIENAGGNKEAAAKALSVSLATLYRKLPEAE